jgi:NAD+ synthase (glutamine-hydrolysing)
MYGVKRLVPNTLIRHIVASVADETEAARSQVLRDI